MNTTPLSGWDRLRHGGLLLDAPRLQVMARLVPPVLNRYHEEELRRQAAALLAGDADASAFVALVLERVCGFAPGDGTWQRGSAVGAEWNRRTPFCRCFWTARSMLASAEVAARRVRWCSGCGRVASGWRC